MRKTIFFVLFYIMLVSAGYGQVMVSYKGLDNVHLSFWDWENFPATIKLKVAETGEVLFQQTLPEGGGTVLGNVHHTGIANGTYTYQLWANSWLRASVSVQINGKIYGELLYDETISDTVLLENNVIVPAGITFNVNGNLVRGNWNNSIYVNGTINFQRGISLQDVNIHFQGGSVNIEKIGGNGGLIFYSQSSGSKL